jgi:hypothetical protein
MGSFRSDWRAQTHASLATLLNTAKRNGQNAFQKLMHLMGSPVLPFLLQSDFAAETVTKRIDATRGHRE